MHDVSCLAERPRLVTERLLLRRPDNGDAEAIVGIVGDRDVARRLARVPHPYGRADARFFLERVVPTEWVWAITLHGSVDLVGAVGLTPDEHGEAAELGYWLSPAHWGRGIVTEAALAVVCYGFDRLDLPCITSGFFLDNPASGRVLQKLGFVDVGRTMRPSLATGGDVPSMVMRLSAPARA